MQHTTKNHQESIEAIKARLEYTVACMQDENAKSQYTLPSTNKMIDFAEQENSWKLSRLVWRIGELKLTECLYNVLKIKKLIKEDVEKYAFVWTLGRIGNSDNISIIENILNKKKISESLKLVCIQSIQMLSKEESEIKNLREEHLSLLPAELLVSVVSKDENSFVTFLRSLLKDNQINSWLYVYYLLVHDKTIEKYALLTILKDIPMRGNYFKPVRQILKAAEQFDDAETVAVIYWRMYHSEPTSGVYRRGDWVRKNNSWTYVYKGKYATFYNSKGYYERGAKVEKESKKENTNFGFTPKSKQYFKTRLFRLLLKTGFAASPLYVDLATSYLLMVNDLQGKSAYTESFGRYHYNRETRRYDYLRYKYYYLPHWNDLVMHKIIHSKIKNVEIDVKLVGVKSVGKEVKLNKLKRVELFPKLWDNANTQVVRLLAESHAKLVQNFAARVFKANPHFAENISAEEIVKMLHVPYLETNQIAVDTIKHYFSKYEEDRAIFMALLHCSVPEAEEIAIQWMEKRKNELLKDFDFVINLITHPKESVNQWIASAIEDTVESKDLFTHLFEYIAKNDDKNPIALEKAIDFMKCNLKEDAQKITDEKLRELVNHSNESLNLLAVYFIKNHKKSIGDFPHDLLLKLMESERVKVRAGGIELFGLLPEEDLYKQQVAVASFCVSPIAEVRAAANPIAIKVSQKYNDFGEDLVETLSSFFLLRGKANEIHDSIANLMTSEQMRPFLNSLSSKRMWRMLNSKKYPAQQVGFSTLKQRSDGTDLEMETIVTLGKHELKDIREWSFQRIENQSPKAIYEADKILRLLETDWEDSRHFMMKFAEEKFKARDWTPELLVSLCDSTRDDIQAFGTKMIRTYFTEENAYRFLLQLSQHPSARIQQMTSEWLAKYAGGKPQTIKKLKPFFLTLLSQVNKGRVAKNRVFDFLETEALNNPEVAEVLIPIYERLVLTIAKGDKAKCILILNQLRKKFPHLEMKLEASST